MILRFTLTLLILHRLAPSFTFAVSALAFLRERAVFRLVELGLLLGRARLLVLVAAVVRVVKIWRAGVVGRVLTVHLAEHLATEEVLLSSGGPVASLGE